MRITERELRRIIREASKHSEVLSQLEKGDQELRNIFAGELKKSGGWSQELADRFAEEHGTKRGDIFGDAARTKELARLIPSLDYASFDERDWKTLNTLALHLREPQHLPLRKRVLREMMRAQFWWRDLATDMARELGMLPELEGKQLSYPDVAEDGGIADTAVRERWGSWPALARDLLSRAR